MRTVSVVPARDPDIVVVGSGPNGLVAACRLAQHGLGVLVLEANPRRPGGALGSLASLRPGFIHDVGAGFFPFGTVSPAFRALDLQSHGLEWCHAPFESCHPAPDGSYACLARDADPAALRCDSATDGDAWQKLASWYRGIEPDLLDALLLTFPALRPAMRLGPLNLLRLARMFASSARHLSSRLFQSEAARRVLPGLGLLAGVAPDDRFGAAPGFMLGMAATTGGYAVPRGGAQSITNALVELLEQHGGRLQLGAQVTRVVVREGRARAVQLADGEEIPAARAVLADTGAPALLLDLLEPGDVPARVQRRMRAFRYGWGTFKVDWALASAVPWHVEAARESALVHAADSIDDLSSFTRQIRSGRLPDNPSLVIGQQSLADPTRAPAGQHTLDCCSRVPSVLPGGWEATRESFADRIEERIEALAPGFRTRILARHIATPPDLESMNANLVGGDPGGGSNAWDRQLLWRPAFPYFRYRMPVAGLYLCSSYTHPGAGAHGMCGYNAAGRVIGDLR